MKKAFVLPSMLFIFVMVSVVSAVTWSDGASHTVNYNVNGDVILDPSIDRNPGTHVNIVSNGRIIYVEAWHHSTVTMSGGIVGGGLIAFDNAVITMTGGSTDILDAYQNGSINISDGSIEMLIPHQNSTVNMSGGSVNMLLVDDNSTVEISGGSFESSLQAGGTSTVYLEGNFSVNGTPLVYGDSLKDFGTFFSAGNYYYGTIIGTLADGSSLDNEFYVSSTADIIIIPEPATVSLLALGGLALLRKRK